MRSHFALGAHALARARQTKRVSRFCPVSFLHGATVARRPVAIQAPELESSETASECSPHSLGGLRLNIAALGRFTIS